MPLYNCFTNEICTNIYLNQTAAKPIVFDSADNNYKIYMLPVKLFKEYTIAIDCADTIEICCCVYDTYLNTSVDDRSEAGRIPLDPIATATYTSVSGAKFNKPFLYTNLTKLRDYTSDTSLAELANHEQALKMFIKLPTNCTSSIVVLEGNYIGWSDSIVKFVNVGTPNSLSTTINVQKIIQ